MQFEYKNILVTGGCGFIASNFLNYMVDKYNYINFFNIDAMYYCASEYNLNENVRSAENYKFIKCNVNSQDFLKFILKNNNIDCVMHFAAQSHVDNSFSTPLQYTEDNIKGTHSLLEACREYDKLKLFIHVSTDEVYGESNLDDNAKDETSVLCPTNPYAASKAAAEMLVQSYIHSYKFPAIITRGNNVYGRNQYPEKLIPKFIESLKKGEKCTIHGDGTSIRSFVHVNDVCKAFELILSKGKLHEIYNIGIHKEYTVLDITTKLVKLIKNSDDITKFVTYVEDRNFNDKRYFINYGKLKDLGWESTIDIDEGLKMIID